MFGIKRLERKLDLIKEIIVISIAGKDKSNLNKVLLELQRPRMEKELAANNAKEADKINRALTSKGEKVRKAWKRYKEDKLALERKGDKVDKTQLALINAKLEILDVLMEGVE